VATIDETGYVAKTQNEYFDEERQLYLNIDPNWNLDPSTPDGLKLASDSEIYGNLDELAQQAYNSKDPSKAGGLELDIVSSLTGTFRNEGTPSNVGLTLFGVAGTQVFAGDLVDSGENTPRWTIDSDVVIGVSGQIAVTATCTVNGATQADPNTITRIVTTRGGWQTVTNNSVPALGTNKQNDTQLRIERAAAVARPGNNQVDNTVGEIFAVEGVRRVAAYENDTGSAAVGPDNPYGLPANSMSYVVDGGSDDDVALAIYVKKNPGVFLNQAGTPVEVTVTSPKYPTNTKVIRFSRPIAVDMVIVIDIVDDGTLPGNVDQLIKDAIIEYTNGELLPADVGFNIQGFNIGENVPLSRINTPINNVIGSYGNSYINGLDINGQTTGAVTINFNKLARFSDANITVNVT
jgi:uncharacterized phage protein gp47/JayE